MLLSGRESDLAVLALACSVFVGTINQNGVGVGRWHGQLGVRAGDCGNLEHGLIIPISDGIRAEIDVVVGGSRSIENDRTNDAVTILARVVGVVPRRSILSGLEGVGVCISRSNWALRDARNTIGTAVVQLPQTVPVDGGSIVLHLVGDCHRDHVAPVGHNCRSRILIVNQQTYAIPMTVWVAGAIGDGELVRDRLAGGGVLVVKVCGDIEAILPARPCFRAVRASCVPLKKRSVNEFRLETLDGKHRGCSHGG